VHRRRRGNRRPGQWADDVPYAPAPGSTAQKTSLHASERDTARVRQARAYHQRSTSLDLQRLKFVDESGVNLAMTRV
jgi:hypothetical protein